MVSDLISECVSFLHGAFYPVSIKIEFENPGNLYEVVAVYCDSYPAELVNSG